VGETDRKCRSRGGVVRSLTHVFRCEPTESISLESVQSEDRDERVVDRPHLLG
jgi:hypothetical protein